jgi:hypothetical protein
MIASMARMLWNSARGGLDKKVVFIHVPKCGGTSVTSAIGAACQKLPVGDGRNLITLNSRASSEVIQLLEETNYPYDSSNDYPVLHLREQLLAYYLGFRNVDFISGHFPFNATVYDRLGKSYLFMTILRDPVQRWISSYFFNRFKSGEHRKINQEIEQYLKSDFGRSQGYEMVKFIGGADRSGDYTSTHALERAKSNLAKFDMVGFIEDMSGFKREFKKTAGATLKIKVKNPSPVDNSLKQEVLTRETLDNIKEICAPDLELYQHAKQSRTAP